MYIYAYLYIYTTPKESVARLLWAGGHPLPVAQFLPLLFLGHAYLQS